MSFANTKSGLIGGIFIGAVGSSIGGLVSDFFASDDGSPNVAIALGAIALTIFIALVIHYWQSLLSSYEIVLEYSEAPPRSRERRIYNKTARNLTTTNKRNDVLAGKIYSKLIKEALNWTEKLLADDSEKTTSLWPRAFGLQNNYSLWTAPSYDRCLYLALIYPVLGLFIVWAFTGESGHFEEALSLKGQVSDLRWWIISLMILLGFTIYRAKQSIRFVRTLWLVIAAVTYLIFVELFLDYLGTRIDDGNIIVSFPFLVAMASVLIAILGGIDLLLLFIFPYIFGILLLIVYGLFVTLFETNIDTLNLGHTLLIFGLIVLFPITIIIGLTSKRYLKFITDTTTYLVCLSFTFTYLIVPLVGDFSQGSILSPEGELIAASVIKIAIGTLASIGLAYVIFKILKACRTYVQNSRKIWPGVVAVASSVSIAISQLDTTTFETAGVFELTFSVAMGATLTLFFVSIILNLNKLKYGLVYITTIGYIVVTMLVPIVSNSLFGDKWHVLAPVLVFYGLFVLVNAPFDWFTIGVTRALLYRGLERKGWWPLVYGLVDLLIASIIAIALAIFLLLSVQLFNAVASVESIDSLINPRSVLLDFSNPNYRWQSGNWWIYFMLFSTMIPSWINLSIGSISLIRGVPLLSKWLGKKLKPSKSVPASERYAIATMLAFQTFSGYIFSFIFVGALIYFVFSLFLPLIGLNLLSVLIFLEEIDLPRKIFEYF